MALRRTTLEHCSFSTNMKTSNPVILGLHGQTKAKATILEVLKYDLRVRMTGQEQNFPKHNVKYLFAPEHWKTVHKTMKVEKILAENPKAPITKIAQRFRIRDDDLQRVIDLKSQIGLTTLEGEKIQAEIKLYSKYEIVLRLKEDAELVVFRHALQAAEAVPLEEVLAAEHYQKKMQKKSGGQATKSGKKKKRRR